jgi:hypothetical protein
MAAEEIDTYLEAASLLLGFPIHPEHYAEIRVAFIVLRAQAAMIAEFSLPEDVEVAPRYSP